MKPVTRVLVIAGLLVPMVFWTTLALCTREAGGYSHLSDQVSELGAAGTATRALFATGLLACSALSLAFVVGSFRACRGAGLSTLPVLVVPAYTFSIAGAAVFPMPHPLHGILGSPSVLLLLSPLLAAVLWRRGRAPRGLLPVSLFSLLVMALGFLVFVPNVLDGHLGLKQRFFHAGWSVWFAYLSVGFLSAPDRRVDVRGPRHAEQLGSAPD